MNNEEKMLSIEDAYDAVVDYLEKIYRKTNSGDAGALAGEMSFLPDGSSADPAALEDWDDSVNKILGRNPNDQQNLELAGNKLTIKQAYEAMTDFLDGYRDRNTSDEIAKILSGMKFIENETSTNPEAWASWIESVKKISNQNPRVRPLLLFRDSKILTVDDAYDTVVDYLNTYYDRTKANNIKKLLASMKRLENGAFAIPTIQNNWNNAVDLALKQNIHNNKDPQLSENGLTATEAYNAVINFLNIYNHEVNSSEIVTLLNGMKFLSEQKSTNPVAWNSWLESVNKTLNKYREF